MKNGKDQNHAFLHIALVFVVALVAALPVLTLAQAYQFKIGVLPFADNTGSNSADVAAAVSRAVQAEMVHSTQLQGRVVTLGPDTDPNSLDGDKAVAIGRAQNVDVIIVGTILEATSEQSSSGTRGPSFGGITIGGSKNTMKASVTLQADLYSTTSGQKIDSIRQTGTASQTKIGADADTGLGDLTKGAADFDNSAMGKAFHSAVSDLVKKISSEQAQMTRYNGGGATPAVSASAPAASSAPSASASSGSPAAAATPVAAAPGGAAQPELKAAKIEFVPGERTVFFDDFSDMAPDEPPPHWKLRDGPVELRTGGGIRELYCEAENGAQLTSPTMVIPVNFTFELEWTGEGEMTWHFQTKDDSDVISAVVRGEADGQEANISIDGPQGLLGAGGIKADTSQPIEFALWAQQGRVRAYLNGQRLVDVNQVDFGPMDHIFVNDAGYRPNGIRTVRVAESAPDFSTVINASGKYVTHGIYFDTDSDHLKPESAPVIKQIATAMDKNPNLKLEIDGYTDSLGDAAHNLDLSKRRAQAVQSVLVSQFGENASRLSSNGMGAGKPIASNDTPQGRAENRRVEFVKQ